MRQSYVWTASDRKLCIHFSLDVVSRLGLEALEAYKSVPRRGLEIGGLLLGRIETQDDRATIYIDDFDPVESEHRSGPSYLLSENDLERLQTEVSSHPDSIGIYRTQTRSEELSLQTLDTQLFEQYFSGPDRVFLLIRPADSTAEVFVRQDGRLAAVHEFPFRVSDLASEAEAAPESGVPAVVEAAPAPPAVERPITPHAARVAALEAARRTALRIPDPPAEPTPAATRPTSDRAAALMAARAAANRDPEPSGRRWNWAIAAAALVLGALAGAAVYKLVPHASSPRTAAIPATTAPSVSRPAEAAKPATEPHVALEVQRHGRALRLMWDRNSPVVRSATHGMLYIIDGSHNSQLDLDQHELGSGLVSYWPETQDVNFRLEVFSPTQSSDDSIRVVGGTPSSAKTPAAAASSDSEPEPASQTAATKPVPPPQTQAPGSQAGADRQAEPDARPSPFQPAPKPAAAPAPVQPIAAVVNNNNIERAAPEAQPEVAVRAEPVTPSRLGAVIGKIPLLRRIHKERPAFVAPEPVRDPRPSLTAQERKALVRPVSVTVKAYLNDAGKVDYAELLSTSGGDARLFGTSAVYTARHWTFTPARVGDQKIKSEVLLHFRFIPAQSVASLR